MSNDMMNRFIWRKDLDPTTKHVATMLADGASDEGVCWPSIGTLMEKTSLSRRAVQKALAKLEGMQLIRKTLRRDTSNFYIMVLDNLPLIERQRGAKEHGLFDFATGAPGTPPPASNGRPPRAPGTPPPRTTDALTLTEPSVEPLLFGDDEAPPTPWKSDDSIVEQVVAKWNLAAALHPGIRRAREPLDDNRRRLILERSKRTEPGQSVEQLWSEFFRHIEASPFLQGREPAGKGYSKPFALSLSWALKSGNFNEIMEGRHDRTGTGTAYAGDGRRMGPAESATAAAISRLRASGERRDRPGGTRSAHQ